MMRVIEREGYELLEEPGRGCHLFDLGGKVSGSSGSNANQSVEVQFVPSVSAPVDSPPVVSSYPAGQGLATLNAAYPASAAWLPATYGATSSTGFLPTTSSISSLMPLLLIAGAGLAAWYFLRSRR